MRPERLGRSVGEFEAKAMQESTMAEGERE
jgi:hypothetical protein